MKSIEKAISESRPTLLEFYSETCPHCVEMEPMVDALRSEYSDKANIYAINIDNNDGTEAEYKVRVVPTWILFKDGQEVWRDSGRKPLSELKDMIDRFI